MSTRIPGGAEHDAQRFAGDRQHSAPSAPFYVYVAPLTEAERDVVDAKLERTLRGYTKWRKGRMLEATCQSK